VAVEARSAECRREKKALPVAKAQVPSEDPLREWEALRSRLETLERTVENHLRNIYQKLHISDRTQAVFYAIKKGLITIP
jgi:ATP/maltotriose-dependent transcriptional regulator MalT